MKKRNMLTLAAIAFMILTVACGKVAGKTADTAMEAPETSSKELLVDGLEYLLSDEKEDVIKIPEAAAGEDYETLRETAQEQSGKEGEKEDNEKRDNEKEEEGVKLSEEGKPQSIIVYYSNGSFDSLDCDVVEAPAKDAETIITLLAWHNIVSLDTKVESFAVEKDETTGENEITLELSGGFEEYLETMTDEAESIIIASLANTFLDNYDAAAICLKVDGRPLKTPYAEYREALPECMPEDVQKMREE